MFSSVYNDNLADDDDSGQDWNELDEHDEDEEIDSDGELLNFIKKKMLNERDIQQFFR